MTAERSLAAPLAALAFRLLLAMDLTILCSAKALDGALDLVSSTFKVTNLVHDLLGLQSLLEVRRIGLAFAADKVTDFIQGETDCFPRKIISTRTRSDARYNREVPSRRGLTSSSILIKP